MKTKTDGVSHAMLGDPGKIGKWLQVEDRPASLLTNPAVLSGVGGLMSQARPASRSAGVSKRYSSRSTPRLDDVRRGQRNAVLAKMGRAAEAIEEAMTIREHGGDPKTLWSKVDGESGTILEVQRAALLALGDLADKVQDVNRPGQLKKTMRETRARSGAANSPFWLAASSCKTSSGSSSSTTSSPRHPKAWRVTAEASPRRERIAGRAFWKPRPTSWTSLTAAGGVANENILLHARAAGSVFGSLNAIGISIDEFHAPLSIAKG
ncbi:hypothetical protein G5V59_26190 [Nocardioides sp. W3-2-3]|uniref:hypothetical protein n=1 Tax=Nocardioides convexus TaxID=2712224 RepID=UPI00241818A8|nr:hypothetical protein [Nocardioides convexus]NHA01944.1 hypothetical protein [Nocardioides convexus]